MMEVGHLLARNFAKILVCVRVRVCVCERVCVYACACVCV